MMAVGRQWNSTEQYFHIWGFAEISTYVLPKCQGPHAQKGKEGELRRLVNAGKVTHLVGWVWRKL